MPPSRPSRPEARRRAGFTLIELLLVMVLLPVVSLTAYSNLSAGLKLWKALNRPVSVEDVEIFHAKASRDFLTAAYFAPVPFRGDATVASFPCVVTGGPSGPVLGQVTYRYDEGAAAIFRDERDYPELVAGTPPRSTPVLRSVSECALSYLVYDEENKRYDWSAVWNGEGDAAPAAVRFTVTVAADGFVRRSEETFLVPVGGA